MYGYHFTGTDRLRDGCRIPPKYTRLIYYGQIVPCQSGLHASEHPFDALQYAPGPILHRVELVGDLVPHGNPIDKWVGRQRTILASIDATELLRVFARWCAMQVVHLWNAPEVVIEYLHTGNESLRSAASAAAWATAWASDAARDAAWSVVRAASKTVARSEASDAASAAAWAIARASDAASAAASDAARDAASDAQRTRFAEIVEDAFP